MTYSLFIDADTYFETIEYFHSETSALMCIGSFLN